MKVVLDARPVQHSPFRGLGRYCGNLIKNITGLDKNNEYNLFFDPNFKIPEAYQQLTKVPHQFGRRQPSILKPDSLFYYRFWLKKELSHLKYDLIHFTSQIHLPPTLPKNSIITVHDIINLALKEMFYKFEIAYLADVKYTRRMFDSAVKIIVDSNNTRRDLINILKIKDSKIDIIPLGIDDHFFAEYAGGEITSTLNKYSINSDYIFYFGGCEERKNVKRLIEVFTELCIDFPHLKMVIVTNLSDPPAQNIMEIARKLSIENKVIFINDVADKTLAILLKAARVFVMPSLYEGFGLPPLEANACRTPVASSYTSSLKEVLSGAAVFFNPLNKKEMYQAIKELLVNEQLRSEIIGKGVKNSRIFSWRTCAEKTISLYENYYKIITNKDYYSML